MLKLNETPRRTSRNFNINNIKLEDVNIPDNIKAFNNLNFKLKSPKDKIEFENIYLNNDSLKYGIGNDIDNIKSNKDIRITINSKLQNDIYLDFNFDKENNELIDNIEIIANEDTKSNIYIKYNNKDNINGFHRGIIKTLAKNNSTINIYIINLLNDNIDNFLSIEDETNTNAKINYLIVDFGGKNTITNLYSNMIGDESKNTIKTIYLGKNNQKIDINYIAELKGKLTNINIDAIGALKDSARKNFKGTIDFKKGCTKSKGSENEFCILLSEKAHSIALPMLLCSEDDVEGEHSSAAGKVDNKELFYIMSRGFSLKDSMKLIVRAKFNKIIENIKNEELKLEIINEMYKRLD